MSENTDGKLKPCPFCGGEAHLLTSNGSFLVECSLCLTDFLNGPVGIGWYRSEKDAAADWNDRPSERALIAQLEAAQLEAAQKERDAWREVNIGAGSNTRAAADIYFQLVAELEVPAGGSLIGVIDNLKAELSAAQKERDELRDKFNEMSLQKQFWVKCAAESESQLEKAEAALSAVNEKHGWIKCSEQMPDPNRQRRVCVFTPHHAADLRYRLVPASLFKAVCSSATHWYYVNDPVEVE